MTCSTAFLLRRPLQASSRGTRRVSATAVYFPTSPTCSELHLHCVRNTQIDAADRQSACTVRTAAWLSLRQKCAQNLWHCRHLSLVQPLSSASASTQGSLTVQAPGADIAAAILAERFALPDSSGIEVAALSSTPLLELGAIPHADGVGARVCSDGPSSAYVTRCPIHRSGALQQAIYGSPPACPALGISDRVHESPPICMCSLK